MKKKFLFGLLQVAALTALAQQNTALKPQLSPPALAASKKVGADFTVELKPAPKGTYLYTIFKGGKKVHTFPGNPATGRPEGFATKEEAYKAAGWAVEEYRKKGVVPPSMPPQTARALKLSKTYAAH